MHVTLVEEGETTRRNLLRPAQEGRHQTKLIIGEIFFKVGGYKISVMRCVLVYWPVLFLSVFFKDVQ